MCSSYIIYSLVISLRFYQTVGDLVEWLTAGSNAEPDGGWTTGPGWMAVSASRLDIIARARKMYNWKNMIL